MQIICILNYYFKKRWMLKTQTYVSETFFFQIAKTIILYWGILWGNVPQLKLFIINKVHLLYDVNYTNPENGLKNAHLDRTSNPSKRNFLRYREGFPISHISGATRFYGSA